MYSHIEDKNYNHLVCVILGGSEKECKLHGLAHVGEHMCLLSCFDNDESYTTFGYTCIDHAVLYFAYRSEGYTKHMAEETAMEWVALPGTSEHQLGLAVDINADTSKCSRDDVYNWLLDNSYKYGFIQRYPSGKTSITGVANEPWHYRYVGKEAAEEIHQSGLCLEEYVENLR